MADLPTTAEIFAFAIFFVPGYLSINIGSRLVGVKIGGLAWLEKVILSYVTSLAIFLLIFLPVGRSLSVDSVISFLTAPVTFLLLIVTVGFGFVLAAFYYLFLRLFEVATNFAGKIRDRLGLGGLQLGSAKANFLNLMWETREVNDLIVETQSNRIFKGQLGSLSIEPTMDLLLVRRSDTQPLMELESPGKWADLSQWSIMVPEGNIRTVHAIKVRRKDN
jgi:hypothetical protein